MLPRLLFGVAACSLVWVLLERERRNRLVCRAYRLADAGSGFDLISGVIEDEHGRFGTESSMRLVRDVASVWTTRRAHEAIEGGLVGTRPSVLAGAAY